MTNLPLNSPGSEVNSHPKVEKGWAGELGRQGGGVEVEGTWRV